MCFADDENSVMLLALHSIAVPRNTKKKPLTKENWKFSIEDSRNYFMIKAKTVMEFEEIRDEKIRKNNDFGLSSNVMLGEIKSELNETSYYVYFDSITYCFDNILEALECAYKVHFVFQIPFQTQCANVWKLLHQYFYSSIDCGEYITGEVRNIVKEMSKK